MFVEAGRVFVVQRDETQREVSPAHSAAPTSIASVGNRAVIGYADGTVAVVVRSGSFSMTRSFESVHAAPVTDIALGSDDVAVTTASDGTVRRLDLAVLPRVSTDDVAVSSTRPIALARATGAGADGEFVLAVDERLERWTTSRGWAGSFARSGVVGPPTNAGALLTATPGGLELGSPESDVDLPGVDGPAVVSGDGSTLLTARGVPRVGPISSIGSAVPLEITTEQVVVGPLALSNDGSAAAAVVDTLESERAVVTFDGRTGEVQRTIQILKSGAREPRQVEIIRLLMSDHVLVVQGQHPQVPGSPRDDRIEIYPRTGGPAHVIPDRRGGSPLSLTTGPSAALYVADGDGVITAHPLAGGDGFAVLDVGDDDVVTAIATEPSGGQLMAVGYLSGRVEMWDVRTGNFVAELSRHTGPVGYAVIGQTPAGLRLSTTSGGEGVVRTLDAPDVLRGALSALSGRDLTVAEWRRFVGVGDPLPCARGLG